MSPDDVGRLVGACLTPTTGGFRVFWGISANTRRWWLVAEGITEVGYQPQDHSEPYAEALLIQFEKPDSTDPVHHLVGGKFCAVPLGERT